MQKYLVATVEGDTPNDTYNLCFGEHATVADVFETLEEEGEPRVTYLCLVKLDERSQKAADKRMSTRATSTIARSKTSKVYKQVDEDTKKITDQIMFAIYGESYAPYSYGAADK